MRIKLVPYTIQILKGILCTTSVIHDPDTDITAGTNHILALRQKNHRRQKNLNFLMILLRRVFIVNPQIRIRCFVFLYHDNVFTLTFLLHVFQKRRRIRLNQQLESVLVEFHRFFVKPFERIDPGFFSLVRCTIIQTNAFVQIYVVFIDEFPIDFLYALGRSEILSAKRNNGAIINRFVIRMLEIMKRDGNRFVCGHIDPAIHRIILLEKIVGDVDQRIGFVHFKLLGTIYDLRKTSVFIAETYNIIQSSRATRKKTGIVRNNQTHYKKAYIHIPKNFFNSFILQNTNLQKCIVTKLMDTLYMTSEKNDPNTTISTSTYNKTAFRHNHGNRQIMERIMENVIFHNMIQSSA